MTTVDINTLFSDYQNARKLYLEKHTEIINLINRRNDIDKNISVALAEAQDCQQEWKKRLRESNATMTQEINAFCEREAARKAMAEEMRVIAGEIDAEIHTAKIKHAEIHANYNSLRKEFLASYTAQQNALVAESLLKAISTTLGKSALSKTVDLASIFNFVSKEIINDYASRETRSDAEEYADVFYDIGADFYSGEYGSKFYINQQKRQLTN